MKQKVFVNADMFILFLTMLVWIKGGRLNRAATVGVPQ